MLGGGLAGLSAASILGNDCILLEKEMRPGGLVRSECVNGYWFDHVLHMLHFQDDSSRSQVQQMLNDELVSCSPVAWVETSAGTTRYPFQMNLGKLGCRTAAKCIRDLITNRFNPELNTPENLSEALYATFGKAMAELFMLPYNRKLWQQKLDSLAPDVSWTIAKPRLIDVIRGALSGQGHYQPYNWDGWYPVPDAADSPRGMERLSLVLAERVTNLNCGHQVITVNFARQHITALNVENRKIRDIRYRKALISTIPLPSLSEIVSDYNLKLKKATLDLAWTRVYSVMITIKGSRPENCGHWRYYSDESLCFTRLVFMHSFDSDSSPPDGWGLLVEIPESASIPVSSARDTIQLAKKDIYRSGILPAECEMHDACVIINDPAYVVFNHQTKDIVRDTMAYLESNNVHALGRYGRWEYSSMAQVIRDGLELGKILLGERCLLSDSCSSSGD